MRHRLAPIPVLVLLALVAPGCGTTEPYRFGLDSTVQVRLNEYRISPQRIIINEGQVSLFAQNDGRLTHNLTIEQADAKIGEEPKVYGRTPTLHPGELGTEVRPFRLKPGTYRMVDTIGNHQNLGMYGELKVIPAGEVPRSR